MKGRLRRIAAWILYLVCLAFIFEAGSYFLLTSLDNRLGDTSERHLYNSIRGHELNPAYQRKFDTDDRKIHSDQGFRRDGPVAMSKPDNTFRIFVMGGSTLYGIGVQDDSVYPKHRTLFNDETITHFLEQKLNDAAEETGIPLEIEVINAGIVAYQTFQHPLYFFETIYQYEPDAVLFLDGHNDFYRITNDNQIKSYGYSSSNLIKNFNDRNPLITIYSVTRYLGQYSYSFKMLEKISRQLYANYEGRPRNIRLPSEAPDSTFSKSLEASARNGFLRNYRLMQTFADYYDFSYHVFLQPEVVFEDPKNLNEVDRTIRQTTFDRQVGDIGLLNMTGMREEFPRLFADFGIPYTDIGTIAEPGEAAPPQLYIDYCHLTPTGSAIVAQRMFPAAFEILQRYWHAGKETASISEATPDELP